jgi:hypothetical protein
MRAQQPEETRKLFDVSLRNNWQQANSKPATDSNATAKQASIPDI